MTDKTIAQEMKKGEKGKPVMKVFFVLCKWYKNKQNHLAQCFTQKKNMWVLPLLLSMSNDILFKMFMFITKYLSMQIYIY